MSEIKQDEYDSYDGYVDALLDRIEALEAENARLHKDMWLSEYCNPTKDLRLAIDRIKELDRLLNEYKDAECKAVKAEGEAKALLQEAHDLIKNLDSHEGAVGWSRYLRQALDSYYARKELMP